MSDTITITGNLAAEPQQRLIGNGVTVTNFRVGSNQRHQDRSSGEWVEDDPNWYQVAAFRRLGEHVFASLRKGDPVIVTGRLKIRHWENEKGKGVSVEIVADAVGHDLKWGTTAYTKAGGSNEWPVPSGGSADAPHDSGEQEWPTVQPGTQPSEQDGRAPDVSAAGASMQGESPGTGVPDIPPRPAPPGASGGDQREYADVPF
jgi:single-strand DNA-binding protein